MLSLQSVTKSPSSVSTFGSGALWANPSNAEASDNSYTTFNVLAGNSSDTLNPIFTFTSSDLPTGAIIVGIEVLIEQKDDGVEDVYISTLTLVNGGGGANQVDYFELPHSDLTHPTTSDVVITAGSKYDAWIPNAGSGNSPPLINPQNWIDQAELYIEYTNPGVSNSVVSIDHVQLKLYYVIGDQPNLGTRPSIGFIEGNAATSVEFGGASWSNPTNALTSNNSYATVTALTADGVTDLLVVSGFAVSSLPDNAEIYGLEVEVEAKIDTLDNWLLTAFLLVDKTDGTIGFYDEITPISLTTSDGVGVVGGSHWVWLYTSPNISDNRAITASIIKSSNFGVGIYAYDAGASANRTISVDRVRLKVHYIERGEQSQSKFPGTATTEAVGDVDWTTPSNALASDNSYAVCALLLNQFSYYLLLSNFGFSIPTGARIRRLRLKIEGKVLTSFITLNAGIIINGVRWGAYDGSDFFSYSFKSVGLINLSDDTFETISYILDYHNLVEDTTYATNFGINNVGYTLSPEDINDSDFGIWINADGSGGADTVSIDAVELIVDYFLEGKTQMQTLGVGR